MIQTAQKVILFSTGILIIASSIKLILGAADFLDKLLGLFAIVLFFFDQLTR